jgi:hypothetical protein
MIMIDVFGVRTSADRADTVLPEHELVELIRSDAISAFQVIVPSATVETFIRLLAACIVTRLAVRVSTILGVPVARKLVEDLDATAIQGTAS